MILTVLLIAGLAGWRLTRAFVEEDVGQKARSRIGRWVYAIPDSVPEGAEPVNVEAPPPGPPSRFRTWIGNLVLCPYCLGTYVTGAITLVVGPQLLDLPILAWLALAAAAAGVQALLVDVQHKIDVTGE